MSARHLLIVGILLGLNPWNAFSRGGTSTEGRIDAFVNKAFELDLVPGAAIVVVQDGRTVYLKGFGWADREEKSRVTPETIFYIASSTKSFTGLAAALLSLRGELDLDASLAESLPSARLHKDLSAKKITLRDLLTHQHGIDNDGPVTFRSAFSGQHTPQGLATLLRFHRPAENGRQFKYGNIGYNVASLAMDHVRGKSWKDVLAEEIFGPLGMTDTTAYRSRAAAERLAMPYRSEKKGYSRLHYAKSDENMHAAGGLRTTAADLAQWLKANLSGAEVDGRRVLPAEAFALAHTPNAKQDTNFGPYRRTGYGLGWNIGTFLGERFHHHFGGFSGFHAHVSFMPDRKIGVAILVNSGLGLLLADPVSHSVYATLLQRPDLVGKEAEWLGQAGKQNARFRERIARDRARRAARPQVLPHPLGAYAGVYENPLLGRVQLKIVQGKLEATMGPLWSAVEVFDGKKNALRVELTGGGSVATFRFGEKEKAIEFESRGMTFTRVDR